MKILSYFILMITTILTCSIANPMQVQAAESIPMEMTIETEDPTLAFEDTLLRLVNEERAKYDLYALVLDETIDAASEIRIGELPTFFAHNRVDGQLFSSVLADFGIFYFSVAEIIAAGQTSPEQALHEWLNSPRHCSRILSSDYSKVGVSHERAADGIDYWEILFIE